MANQIKSKQRVAEHGEVFTAEREVNAMLNLVKQETERIDSRFLEPACGNGNFLVEILRRKLTLIHDDVELVRVVCSIYGIDILQDNVEECRERLLNIIRNFKHDKLEGDLLATIRFVLQRNIVWGDALTLCEPGPSPTLPNEGEPHPIIFSEWGFIGEKVKRRDYTLDMLLRSQPMQEPNLFSDLGDEAFIPTPCAEYKPIHYLKLHTQDAAHQ